MKSPPDLVYQPQQALVGVIDIGSNSIRLVVYDGLTRTPVTVFTEKATCELARDIDEDGNLRPEKMALALANLSRFAALVDTLDVAQLKVVATSAARVAKNGPEFARQAGLILGKPVEIISGEEEARLSALGVLAAFPEASGIVGDLGGGSLELAELKGGKIGKTVTLTLGHQRLAHLAEFGYGGVDGVINLIDRDLAAVPWLKKLAGKTFYAVGGGWRRLAELHMAVTHYPLPVVHSYHLSGDALERFLQPRKLLFQKEESQKSLGLSKKQAEVITFASLALDGVLRHGRPAHVIFSTSGLREGCLFDLLPPSETAADPLLRACEQFARRISCLPPNTDELEEWVLRLFPDADEPFRRLCKAACLLCDISLYESRDFRSRNAFERIINLPLLGIDHAGRVFLALVLHARYAGNLEGAHLLPFLDFLHPDDVERALDLGLTLRLAQTLCGRTQGILMHTQLQVDGDELVLLAPTDMPFVIGDAVQKHLKALANALALNPSIQECESPAQPVF